MKQNKNFKTRLHNHTLKIFEKTEMHTVKVMAATNLEAVP